MSIREVQGAVRDWSRRGEAWAEAILVAVRRSAPRPPGARYAVGPGGAFAGNLSAGCVEADLHERLSALLGSADPGAADRVSYGISDDEAAGVGLSCGGEIDVVLRRHEAADPVWGALAEALEEGRREWSGALITDLSDGNLGGQLLVDEAGPAAGEDGASRLLGALEARDRLFGREGSETLELPGVGPVFVDRILPPRRLVVVGASAIGAALARLAPSVGYRVVVIDPRRGLVEAAGLEGPDVRVEWPDEALADLPLDGWTDVAVLAHDERLDLPALRAALEAGCRYVGLLGGRRTQRVRREALRAEGVSEPDLERIRGPIGLDVGAVTPAEIAVSILAELLAVRRLGATDG